MIEQDYQRIWRQYRRIRFRALVMPFAWFLLLGATAGSLYAILGRVPKWVAIPAGLAWLIGSAYTSFRLTLFRCPRCQKRFVWTWVYRNDFTNKCLHCGLRIGDDPSRSEPSVSERDRS